MANEGWSLGDSLLLGVLVALAVAAVWWWLAGADRFRRAGLIGFVVAGLVPLWVNGAVGIMGDEDNPANLMFVMVSVFGAIGAALVKFRAAGLARTAQLAAALHVAVVALLWLRGGEGLPAAALLLALPWLLSAALLKRALQAIPHNVAAGTP